jgi:hypothetical protein
MHGDPARVLCELEEGTGSTRGAGVAGGTGVVGELEGCAGTDKLDGRAGEPPPEFIGMAHIIALGGRSEHFGPLDTITSWASSHTQI